MTLSNLLSAFCIAALVASASVRAADPPTRPNIFFILIDDMGYRDLSCFGGQRVQTPHIDRLAREGMRFNQFYVASPICSPSRIAFTTGRHPLRYHITSYLDTRALNQRRGIENWLDPKAPSLARILADARYHSAHIGKWHMGGQRDVGDAPPIAAYGFATSLTNFEGLGPRILPKFDPKPDGTPVKHGPTDMSAKLGGDITWIERHKVSEAFVTRAIAEMQQAQRQNKPFYINLWPDDVHSPCHAPPDLRGDNSPAANYLGVLRNLDTQLGRAFDFIRSQPNLRDNTIILLCSDNGHEVGLGSSGELRGSKGQLYEGGIRSPLIVWYPGHMPKPAIGTTNDSSLVSALDIPPSLLALAGTIAPKTAAFDGIEMNQTLTGRAVQQRTTPLMWLRPPDRPGPNNSLPDLAIREGNWKLLTWRDESKNKSQLFDLAADPTESTDLSAIHPDLVKRLRQTLLAWEKSTGK
jgi:arylsulfatase A-like enzyme